MSRIGKLPIQVPSGVTITVDDKHVVTVVGPKGTLSQFGQPDVMVTVEEGKVIVGRANDEALVL